MNCTGELEENVDLQRCNLRHCLRRVKQFFLGDGLESVAAGRVQVDTLDELHVVQQRAEGHEIRKRHFVPLSHLNQVVLDFRRQ